METAPLNSLFTLESLLSLQGSAAAALLIPNVFAFLFGEKFDKNWKKWTSFVIAMALAFLVAILAKDAGYAKWIIAFINGFVVFASAVGINQGIDDQNKKKAGVLGGEPNKKAFFKSWF